MNIPKKDLNVETMKGKGPGGTRKNKVETACRITHLPTGIVATADTRSLAQSKKKALADLIRKIKQAGLDADAAAKKAERDRKIKESPRVRTYDYTKNTVTDHRTKRTATIKQILQKGEINRLWDV